MKLFSSVPLKKLCKKAFRISLVFSLTVFAFLRMIFFELPFSVEDLINLTKVIAAGFFMTILAGVSFYSLVAILSELKRFLLNPNYNQPKLFNRIMHAVTVAPGIKEEQHSIYPEPMAA